MDDLLPYKIVDHLALQEMRFQLSFLHCQLSFPLAVCLNRPGEERSMMQYVLGCLGSCQGYEECTILYG